MANALFHRREAFLSNNASSPLSPLSRSLLQSPLMNGDRTSSPKDLYHPVSPIGVSGVTPTTAKKFAKVNVKELHGTVGFANIPNQVFRKATKQGFEFTLMVVGQSGLGKSTFLNSLFSTDLHNADTAATRQTAGGEKTLQINECTVQLVENSVSLTLTLVDTPGFGDAVDNSQCWDPIIEFVDKKFFEYFSEETNIYRKERISDNRVHCCLYFIAPTGHGLKPLDIEFMKHLHDRVNIIPVIAKADTMTPDECAAFKEMVAKELADNNIQIYEFPEIDNAEDMKEQRQYKSRVPFAVVGSNVCEVVGGRKIRCRKYPWGTVEVENLEHNDFIALRNTLIRTYIIDLIDVTRFVHYENFRCRQLVMSTNSGRSTSLTKDPFTQMEERRRESELHMKQEDAKREELFHETLAGNLEQLKQGEQEIDRHIEQMKRVVEVRRHELDMRRATFMQERSEFIQQYPEFQKYSSGSSLSDKEKLKKKRSVFSRDSHNVSSSSSRLD